MQAGGCVLGMVSLSALLTAASLGVACAILSVFVVMRRWAFIGEGISHSGLGGAGMAWVLALLFPAFDQAWAPYALAAVCCVVTAVGIGFFSRTGKLNADAAIGIFLVATVAWGFLAEGIYMQVRHHQPYQWESILLGRFGDVSASYALASAAVCGLVVFMVGMLGKEILSYCFDPVSAEVSGVRAGLVHYLLMVLIALTVVIGVRVVGSLLVTALLVLPGVTGMMVTLKLRGVFSVAVMTGLVGTVGGLLIHGTWLFLPPGPVIVLVMLGVFLVAWIMHRVRGT
jgi:ABC-type Mn2+/Zn2+ transport system permease subunit